MSKLTLPPKRQRPVVSEAALQRAVEKTGFGAPAKEAAPREGAGDAPKRGAKSGEARSAAPAAKPRAAARAAPAKALRKRDAWGKLNGPTLSLHLPSEIDFELRTLAALYRTMPTRLVFHAVVEFLEKEGRLPEPAQDGSQSR